MPEMATIVKALEELKNPEPGFEQMLRPTDVEGVNAPVCRRSRLIETCAWLVERVGAPALAAEAGLLERYVELLAEHGVTDYSVEVLRREIPLALLAQLAGTVGWLTNLDESVASSVSNLGGMAGAATAALSS